VLRRIKIQADNVGGFGLKIGIVARQVALQAVRLDAAFLPHAMR
jgi:hypothetical protein